MFTIMGADGKEYGPVPADKVQAWITSRRANLQTKARREGETEWKTLGDFAEFAAAPAPVAGTAPPPPPAPITMAPMIGTSSPAAPSTVHTGAGPLDITGCIKKGLATGLANYWPILGVSLLVGLCISILGAIPILGIFASLVLNGVFYGGLYYYVLKKVRGESTEIGDAFSGFSVCFGQLALASIVVILLVFLACLLLILPGIYLAVCWIFTFPLVRDKGLGFWEAMELGRKVITAQWFRVFGLLLLICIVMLALFAVPIGIIFMGGVSHAGTASFLFIGMGVVSAVLISLGITPFLSSTLMHAYEELFGPSSG